MEEQETVEEIADRLMEHISATDETMRREHALSVAREVARVKNELVEFDYKNLLRRMP